MLGWNLLRSGLFEIWVTFVTTSWLLSSEASASFPLSPITMVAYPTIPSWKLPSPSPGSSSPFVALWHRKPPVLRIMPFSCTSDTDTVWEYQSKHPAFLWERPFPFTLESVSSPSCFLLFSWVLQDHDHKARTWVDHGALGLPTWHQKCGPGLLPGLPLLPSPPSAWLLEVIKRSGRHRVSVKHDVIFAGSIYYLLQKEQFYFHFQALCLGL